MTLVPISLGFTLEVDEYGRFELPSGQTYSTSELNKIAREVNRHLRKLNIEHSIGGQIDV